MFWTVWAKVATATTIKHAIFGAPIGAFISAIIGGIFADNTWPSAGIAGLIGGTLTTALLIIPRVMEQGRKRRETEHTIKEDAVDKLFVRVNDFYERQLEEHNNIIDFLRLVASERDLIATLERRSKHSVLNQLNATQMIVHELEGQLKGLGVTALHPHKSISYDQMCREQDMEIIAAKRRIAAAAARKNAVIDALAKNAVSKAD